MAESTGSRRDPTRAWRADRQKSRGSPLATMLAATKYIKGSVMIQDPTLFVQKKAAIAAMITNGEYEIKRIVAVWKDEAGSVFVIPPCGNCRQLIRETNESNLEAEVILDADKDVLLKELLPYYDWWNKQ